MKRTSSLLLFGLGAVVLAGTFRPQPSHATPTLASAASSARNNFAAPRLLYSGDWSGSREIYAADPAHPSSIAQITFGQDASCDPLVDDCGFTDAVPSPDGRDVAFETDGICHPESFSLGSGYLYVAQADGRGPRTIAAIDGCSQAAWSPDSRRLAYVRSATVWVVDADGSHNHRVSSGEDPAWSPDGRSLAALNGTELWIERHGRFRDVASGVKTYAWSPTGAWLAVAAPNMDIVRPDGSHLRLLNDNTPLKVSWSHDGRYVAYSSYLNGAEIVDIKKRTVRVVGAIPGGMSEAWSHRGDQLAFDGRDGLSLFDARRGTTRDLTPDHSDALTWAPDDRSIAYLDDGDIRITSLAGEVRTLVSAAGTAGGLLDSLTWTSPAPSVRYQPVVPRAAATVSADTLVAPWPIEHLAADGSHVAYVTCGHVFVWAPASGELVQAEQAASLAPNCTTPRNYLSYDIYDVALAGDRIAFGTRSGNMSQGWDLYEQPLADPASIKKLDTAFGYAGCTLGAGGLGDLVGAGDLLVFSRWQEPVHDSKDTCGIATDQRIYRSDANGCPCPQIASASGPLLPADVDGDRIVAVGSNDTQLLDRNGKQLLSLPVQALAAQLSGSDLVVLVQGQLRDYDAKTGALAHAWPLPAVPSGSPCGSPHPWGCPSIRLELEDTAHGLAAYVLDGEIHVVRLADGSDQPIGKGTTARFMADGLVYADGADLHLITYAKLPSNTTP